MTSIVHRVVLGAILCLGVPGIPVAFAGDAPPDGSVDKARASFQQGVELFHEGSFEAAVVEFRKAYRLAPSFRILFNIGQSYYELHDYVNAIRTFQQYLADGKSDIPAARRAEVEEMVEKLEARTARLDVQTNVDGAEVMLDDVSAGLSPLPFAVTVNAGHRHITVSKEGYQTATRTVDVSVGEQATVLVTLVPSRVSVSETGGVRTASSPIKAAVPRSSNALAISVVVTATCAVGATVFGLLALQAKREFEHRLTVYPTTQDRVDSARASMLTYAVVTDLFATAALVGAGMSVYYLWTRPDPRLSRATSAKKRSVVLQPALGGLVLNGHW